MMFVPMAMVVMCQEEMQGDSPQAGTGLWPRGG